MIMASVLTMLITNVASANYRKQLKTKLKTNRCLWLLFWYAWVDPRVPLLKFSNTTNMIPCLYSPPSVLICFIYLVLVLEMLAIGYLMGYLSVGLVLAYAIGELLLFVVNAVMGRNYERVKVTEMQLHEWRPRETHNQWQEQTI
eukprot:gnl/TRDRNA2_/TRDRNA2_158715_c0_seq2.p1 gnl/TRDRNA2_/TRDRNA2_158715_c0~~gnl/TRDRNA2_/TRDRNA2_158715_c0_seq2.p1  ORF type:complete len:144 (-),score=13.58 gnl/TRDRNA2_/TRDRNA2_158715_c0_seq2:398-829(-)